MEISEVKASTLQRSILHPGTGEELGITVELLPMTAPEVKTIIRQVQDQTNWLAARGKPMSAKDREKWELKMLSVAIKSWDWGTNTFHGEVPSIDLKDAVLEEKEWFRSQIDDALGEVKSFFVSSK